MKNQEIRLTTPAPEKLLPEVLLRLGYPPNKLVAGDILAEIKRQVRLGSELVTPKALYRLSPIVGWGKGRIAAQGFEVASPMWTGLLSRLVQPELLCVFAVTLGARLDEGIVAQQQVSMFQAFLLDAAGSVLAEEMADQVETFLRGVLEDRGYRATSRFSPGYCDWEVGPGQTAVFGFLKPENLGLRLSPGGMMVPRKSVSACVVGARKVPLPEPCGFCVRRECSHRRAGGRPGLASSAASGGGECAP